MKLYSNNYHPLFHTLITTPFRHRVSNIQDVHDTLSSRATRSSTTFRREVTQRVPTLQNIKHWRRVEGCQLVVHVCIPHRQTRNRSMLMSSSNLQSLSNYNIFGEPQSKDGNVLHITEFRCFQIIIAVLALAAP